MNQNSHENEFFVLEADKISLDGGVIFGNFPRMDWEEKYKPDRLNRIRLGVYSLLLRNGNDITLVNTGAGIADPADKARYGLGAHRLGRQLKRHGIHPRDISRIIFTGPQFYFCEGATHHDRRGDKIPTFTHADHFLPKKAWEDMRSNKSSGYIHHGDLSALEELGRLRLVEGDGEIAPGISVELADDCNLQVVRLTYGSERIVYAGDMFPTEFHIQTPSCVPSHYKENREDAQRYRENFLDRAVSDGQLLVSGLGYVWHDGVDMHERRLGYPEKHGDRIMMRWLSPYDNRVNR